MSAHDMNAMIRRAARGYVSDRRHDALDVRHVENIGVGRGAGSAPRRVPSRSEQINRSIRDAAGYVRQRITFNDLWR